MWDLSRLSELVNSWVPQGWQSKKDELLEPACQAVLQSLLKNPNFKVLSAASSKLEGMRTNIKALNNDGCGPVCAPQVLKDAGWAADQLQELHVPH